MILLLLLPQGKQASLSAKHLPAPGEQGDLSQDVHAYDFPFPLHQKVSSAVVTSRHCAVN